MRLFLREIVTLFWLQGKLTLSMFRSRRVHHRAALLRLLLVILQFIFSIPVLIGLGIALGVGMVFLSPRAAFEAVIVVNTFLLLVWLFAPASYSSQLLERFEMTRLFPYPIHFRSMVVGSTLMGMVTMTGLWTLPLLVGEVLGLAWHAPLALPLILLGALPTLLLLTLTGRIMDDLLDLVAGDRRLRALMLFLISLPFMLLWMGQMGVQIFSDDFTRLPEFLPALEFEGFSEVESISEFLEILRPSRWLLWLPSGWVTAAMAYPVTGAWGRALLFLLLSLLTVGGLLWLHAGVTRRLMSGAALTIGTETVRSRRRRWQLPLPTALQALLDKDFRHLWRNPHPRRMFFGVLLMTLMVGISFFRVSLAEMSAEFSAVAPFVFGVLLLSMASLTYNVGFTVNYFGTIDREGFGTLMTSSADRRWVLLSANLTTLWLALIAYLLPLFVLAVALRTWRQLPLLFYLGVCAQLSGTPFYTLIAILFPYRMPLQRGAKRRGGNLWGVIGWSISIVPVAFLLLPYFLWKPALWITLPLSAVYAVGLYVLTLRPLAKLLQRREGAIFEAITTD